MQVTGKVNHLIDEGHGVMVSWCHGRHGHGRTCVIGWVGWDEGWALMVNRGIRLFMAQSQS